jgi:hypothetical protein
MKTMPPVIFNYPNHVLTGAPLVKKGEANPVFGFTPTDNIYFGNSLYKILRPVTIT